MSAHLSITALGPMLPALLRFTVACAVAVPLGLALARLLPHAARRWPALAGHRGTWLSAQGALLIAFLLALAPLPRAHFAPALALPPVPDTAAVDTAAVATAAVDIAAVATAPVDAAAATGRDAVTAPPALRTGVMAVASTSAPHASSATRHAAGRTSLTALAIRALPWLGALWLAVYAGGLLVVLARRWQTERRWRAMLRHDLRPLDERTLATWPGCTPDQVRRIAEGGLAVRTTALPVSPMLLGVLRPCLLLPAQLQELDVAQRGLIVEHELTHWRRRDPLWLAASSCVTLLLWFVPACRLLDAGLREAVELGCDDAVLTGRTARERQGYAAALVAQLRRQHDLCAAPAFGQLGVAARIQRMRMTTPPRLSATARMATMAASIGLAAGTAALLPSLSTAAPHAAVVRPAAAVAQVASTTDGASVAWRYPLADARVTSLFGVKSALLPAGHQGIDFAARRGTPVLAVAAGTVAETGNDPALGNYVRIDHGAGRASQVIHLDRVDVATGQRVRAGQVLGASGATGRATGPHLHLEYWQDGRKQDPALMFADLDRHATPRALARRAAQASRHPTSE